MAPPEMNRLHFHSCRSLQRLLRRYRRMEPNFAPDTVIGQGSSGKVYRGRLYDGREMAIKRYDWLSHHSVNEFSTELDILSLLRHKHIIRLFGSCVTVSEDKHLLTTPQKKKKGLLARLRKEPEELEEPETLIVYEYMENGTLSDHLHPDQGASALSPVTVSWKMRVEVLLGVSRAIEYLHCHANPPIIHRDVKPSNILFDANWVPRVSDFGLSLAWDMASEESGMEAPSIAGTFGYMAQEYLLKGLVKPASDVYSLGVVMLEVLTGKKALFQEINGDLASFAIPIIDADNIEELLDRRLVPEPTPCQLLALKRVSQIARCCVKFAGEDRPAISGIVVTLERVLELICRDGPCSDDAPGLWPFFEKVDLPPDTPHARSVSSADYYSDQEPEVLENGR